MPRSGGRLGSRGNFRRGLGALSAFVLVLSGASMFSLLPPAHIMGTTPSASGLQASFEDLRYELPAGYIGSARAQSQSSRPLRQAIRRHASTALPGVRRQPAISKPTLNKH